MHIKFRLLRLSTWLPWIKRFVSYGHLWALDLLNLCYNCHLMNQYDICGSVMMSVKYSPKNGKMILALMPLTNATLTVCCKCYCCY